jgi:organic hydroperoxide reductase OsmC/OhrA
VSQAAAKLKLKLDDERVSVVARFEEAGSVLAGTKTGRCLGFEIELSIHSTEPARVISNLLRQAHATCYTEQALAGNVELLSTHLLNGAPLVID